jgi:hypothetical protein
VGRRLSCRTEMSSELTAKTRGKSIKQPGDEADKRGAIGQEFSWRGKMQTARTLVGTRLASEISLKRNLVMSKGHQVWHYV